MLALSPSTRVFICSNPIDMRSSFDSLSGLIQSHFGRNPACGYLFVFFSRRRDRMKVMFWDLDGFALYYKRLERGTFTWVTDLDLDDGGEIQASDFSMILTGINPCSTNQKHRKTHVKAPLVPPLQLV
jgi:transposase